MKTIVWTLLIAVNLSALATQVEANERYKPANYSLTEPSPPDEEMTNEQEDPAELLVNHGLDYLGIRYRRGGSNPKTGLDCSGLVQNVFSQSLGLQLPRTAAAMARMGDKIERDELKPGDLVFFNTARRANSHVGIYVGGGQMLHAPSSGGVVRIEDIGKKYWRTRFNGARRLLASGS